MILPLKKPTNRRFDKYSVTEPLGKSFGAANWTNSRKPERNPMFDLLPLTVANFGWTNSLSNCFQYQLKSWLWFLIGFTHLTSLGTLIWARFSKSMKYFMNIVDSRFICIDCSLNFFYTTTGVTFYGCSEPCSTNFKW